MLKYVITTVGQPIVTMYTRNYGYSKDYEHNCARTVVYREDRVHKNSVCGRLRYDASIYNISLKLSKKIWKRQFIHYIVYQKSIIWKLPQKRRRYLVSMSQITYEQKLL
jgi:hypothetical protein